jgi:CiaD-like protein
MELKDVILSTLAEMEDNEITKKVLNSSIKPKKIEKAEISERKIEPSTPTPLMKEDRVAKEENSSSVDGEILFLNSLKERLLVLFEGFQAPNNTNIEAKVDMTLNFLEYALATIDLRAEELEKGKVK